MSDAHQMRNCSGRLCDVNGCGKPHRRLLHRPCKNEDQMQNVENVDEVSNLSSMRSSGVLPVFPVSIGSGSKTLKTFALCDSGASLSFVDESLMKTLNLTGQPVDMNVAGIHGTSDISSKRLRVKTEIQRRYHGLESSQRKCGKSIVRSQEIEGYISSPVRIEGLYSQLGRCQSYPGARLLTLA